MPSRSKWAADRPHTLVIACSDGRLEDQTDEFLHGELGLAGFDRFYVPGGGGALASSGPDFFRAVQMRTECSYLVKLPTATPQHVAERQGLDALELMKIRHEWAGKAEVAAYRCEVQDTHHVSFVELDVSG